jgi:hypothetical protein
MDPVLQAERWRTRCGRKARFALATRGSGSQIAGTGRNDSSANRAPNLSAVRQRRARPLRVIVSQETGAEHDSSAARKAGPRARRDTFAQPAQTILSPGAPFVKVRP